MTTEEKISELNSIALMMSPHPENNKDSEFNARLNGLCRVIESMQKELNSSKMNKSIRIIKDQVMNIEHENLCALVDHKLITDCCKSIMIETDKLESNIVKSK